MPIASFLKDVEAARRGEGTIATYHEAKQAFGMHIKEYTFLERDGQPCLMIDLNGSDYVVAYLAGNPKGQLSLMHRMAKPKKQQKGHPKEILTDNILEAEKHKRFWYDSLTDKESPPYEEKRPVQSPMSTYQLAIESRDGDIWVKTEFDLKRFSSDNELLQFIDEFMDFGRRLDARILIPPKQGEYVTQS